MGASRDYTGATNSYLDYGDPTFLDGATSASWGGWVQFDSLTSGTGTISAKGGYSTGSYYAYIDDVGAGAAQLMLARDDLDVKSVYSSDDAASTLYDTSSWFFVQITWSQPTTWSLYVDGVSKGVSVWAGGGGGSPSSLASVSVALRAGQVAGEPATFDGRAAYHNFYTAVLSAPQIAEIQYNPFAFPKSLKWLSPGWRASGTNEVDVAGGLSGTPSNAATSSDGPPVYLLAGQ